MCSKMINLSKNEDVLFLQNPKFKVKKKKKQCESPISIVEIHGQKGIVVRNLLLADAVLMLDAGFEGHLKANFAI